MSESANAPAASAKPANWLTNGERGTIFGIRFLVMLCTFVGRGPARAFLKLVVLYYLLVPSKAHRASKKFLAHFYPRVTAGLIYRHFLNFAEVALDRFFLLKGRFDLFSVQSSGFENLRKLQSEKRGAILLGAHCGSFEAMRLIASGRKMPINILTYTGNARKLNGVLAAVSPGSASRFIELIPGDVSSVLRVKELVEAGELVAILGDRDELDSNGVVVDFFGEKARFPSSLYVLAAVLHCPIFFTFSVYRSPNQYEFICEPFVDRIELKRGDREGSVAAYVQRYAKRLEEHCRLAPTNWFNFYDVWGAN